MLNRFTFIVCCLVLLNGCAGDNRPLQMVAGADPAYPDEAREAEVGGFVVVVYDVTVEGRVMNARIVESEPAGVFDEAALATVRSWRFNAPMIEGERVATQNRRSTLTFQVGERDEYNRD